MVEGEPVGVEELALEAVLALAAVGRVADQGVADRGEVGADLVGAAGLQTGLEVGLGAEQLDHLEVGAGLARGGARDRHPVALARGASDRGVDRAGARGEAALAPGRGRSRSTSRRCTWACRAAWVASLRATTSRPLVSLSSRWTIPGRSGSAPPPSRSPSSSTRVGPLVRGRRVNDQPRRLVNHRQVVVDMDDPQLRDSNPTRSVRFMPIQGAKGAPEVIGVAQVGEGEEQDAAGDGDVGEVEGGPAADRM